MSKENSLNLKEIAIIVVEDNTDNLFLAMELLKVSLGIEHCTGRASGRQLFNFIEANPTRNTDLILLDIQIPHEDGYAVIKKIKETPSLQKTKVVAFTANVMPHDVERARNSGFDGFIGKPINPVRFPEQLKRILLGEAVWEPR